MKNNYNKFEKNTNTNEIRKDTRDYSYYSRVLEKPFDSIEELKAAEATYFAAQRAKEDKAAAKRADAKKVEEAFKVLNNTRRSYKDSLIALTEKYSNDLKALKDAFESDKKDIEEILSTAENAYAAALKEFTDKYPEGYHLTLKDGDFETTISGSSTSAGDAADSLANIFGWIFG